jgi:hypothetical protein
MPSRCDADLAAAGRLPCFARRARRPLCLSEQERAPLSPDFRVGRPKGSSLNAGRPWLARDTSFSSVEERPACGFGTSRSVRIAHNSGGNACGGGRIEWKLSKRDEEKLGAQSCSPARSNGGRRELESGWYWLLSGPQRRSHDIAAENAACRLRRSEVVGKCVPGGLS